MYEKVLEKLGLDLDNDSIKDTPRRVAKMFTQEIFYGLDTNNFPKITVVENKSSLQNLVVTSKIPVLSMCEHHLMPIEGYCAVGYIAKEKVLGLSKFNRIVDYFSRRPQIQERLTEQIYLALRYILQTDDVAVLISAKHGCVSHRGACQSDVSTITERLGGNFFDDYNLRAEFMSRT